MIPNIDFASICKQIEAMSLVDRPIQLTGKIADDVQKIQRILQEAIQSPVGATPAERAACRKEAQSLSARLKVFSPELLKFQQAILNHRDLEALQLAANPVIFQEIQAASAYLKLQFGPSYERFLSLKAWVEKLLPLLRNGKPQEERAFVQAMGKIASSDINHDASRVLRTLESLFKNEERSAFIKGCFEKAKAFLDFEYSLLIGDWEWVVCALAALNKYPIEVRKLCIDIAKEKYANVPKILQKITLASLYDIEDIFLAHHLTELLKGPSTHLTYKFLVGYKNRIQKSMAIIAFVFPNEPMYTLEKVRPLLPRIHQFLALHQALFSDVYMGNGDNSDLMNEYANKSMADARFTAGASKAVLQASPQACGDTLRTIRWIVSSDPINVYIDMLQAVRKVAEAANQDNLNNALIESIAIDPKHMNIICATILTHLPQTAKISSLIQSTQQFHKAFYQEGINALLELLFTSAPGSLQKAMEHLIIKYKDRPNILERATKALNLVKTVEGMCTALSGDSKKFIENGTFLTVKYGAGCFVIVLRYLEEKISQQQRQNINIDQCHIAVGQRSIHVSALIQPFGDISSKSLTLKPCNMAATARCLKEISRTQGLEECQAIVMTVLKWYDGSHYLLGLQLLETYRDLLVTPAAFHVPPETSLQEENAKIARVFELQEDIVHPFLRWSIPSYISFLQGQFKELCPGAYQKELSAVKQTLPQVAKEIDRLDVRLRFNLNPIHLKKGLVPFIVPEAAQNVPLEELLDRFTAANFTENELKVRLSSDFTEEDARLHLQEEIQQQKMEEIRRKRISDSLPPLSAAALLEELGRQMPPQELQKLVNERLGAYFPRLYIRNALQKFVANIKAKAPIALVPRGEAGHKWYKEIHSMLTHIIKGLRDANSETVKDCLVDILQAAGHCAVGIQEAIIRRYRQVVMGQSTTPIEEIYESLARYRDIICESLMVPVGMRESVMFYSKLGHALGEEFGLPNFNRFRETEAIRYEAYGKVDSRRDRVRFFGFYNVGSIVEFLAPDINGVKAKKDFCLSCIPKDWKRPSGMEYEALKKRIHDWKLAGVNHDEIVTRLKAPDYDFWTRKQDLDKINDLIDLARKTEYMASVINQDGSVTYEGIANMLTAMGVFQSSNSIK